MTPYQALRTKTVLGLLDKFPETPSRTIARICYRDNPELFRDEDDVRCIIRYYRGAMGVRNRQQLKDKKYVRKQQSV